GSNAKPTVSALARSVRNGYSTVSPTTRATRNESSLLPTMTQETLSVAGRLGCVTVTQVSFDRACQRPITRALPNISTTTDSTAMTLGDHSLWAMDSVADGFLTTVRAPSDFPRRRTNHTRPRIAARITISVTATAGDMSKISRSTRS